MVRRRIAAPEPPGESGGAAGAPGGLPPEPPAAAPLAAAPGGRAPAEAAAVEDHAPDPPDPLNDMQAPADLAEGSPPTAQAPVRRAAGAAAAPPIQSQARRGARHRAGRARDAAPSVPGAGTNHLHRLLTGPSTSRCGTTSPRFIAAHRPEWAAVRWINVDGLGDLSASSTPWPEVPPAPPGDRGRAPRARSGPRSMPIEATRSSRRGCSSSPACWSCRTSTCTASRSAIFLGHKTVLTFQETRATSGIRSASASATAGSRLRQNDASFLVYSLLDAIVDQLLPDPRALRRPARGPGGPRCWPGRASTRSGDPPPQARAAAAAPGALAACARSSASSSASPTSA